MLLLVLLIVLSSTLCAAQTVRDAEVKAQNRFVFITTRCQLGSGFLTGHTHLGLQEVVTAYHLVECPQDSGPFELKVNGVPAAVTAVSRQHDLMRLLVQLDQQALPVTMRTVLPGEQVFSVGTNSMGERGIVTSGKVIYLSPGQVNAKLLVPHGTSGGQLVAYADGALVGMLVRVEFEIAISTDALVVFQFLTAARRADAMPLPKPNRAF